MSGDELLIILGCSPSEPYQGMSPWTGPRWCVKWHRGILLYLLIYFFLLKSTPYRESLSAEMMGAVHVYAWLAEAPEHVLSLATEKKAINHIFY